MVVHPLCLSLIVSWEGVIVTTKASAVTYQEYHCLIDPLFLTSNPFPDLCILERPIDTRAELSGLASIYGYQTALQGQPALISPLRQTSCTAQLEAAHFRA